MTWRTGGRIKRANGGGTTTRQAEVAAHREVGLDAGSRRSGHLAWLGGFYLWNGLPLGDVGGCERYVEADAPWFGF